MVRHPRFRLAMLVAATISSVVALGACDDDDDDDVDDAAPRDVGTAPPTSSPDQLDDAADREPTTTASVPARNDGADPILPFLDEFENDSNGWGGPYQRFEDGDYVWELPSGQRDTRAPDTLIRVEDEIDDVEVAASLTTERIAAVSIQCAFEELGGSSRWYDLELGASGASIHKQDVGSSPVETLATNPDVTLPPDRTEVELRAICAGSDVDYSLRLLVDGTLAVEFTDEQPFGRAGAPNLSAIALPDDGEADASVVRFHRFEVVTAK